MLSAAVDLLQGASATGPAVTWPGGKGMLTAAGTFGGCTLVLQILGPDDSTWLAVNAATSLSAPGAGVFDLPQGQIRAAVSGGTPGSLYARAARVPV